MFDARGKTPKGGGDHAMRIAPLDLRQQRFRKAMRGFDPAEVTAFLTEAADDYEKALREIDELRQALARQEAVLGEHRERETNLRNTLLTAQKLADEIKQTAQNEAQLIVREAEGRANLILEKAKVRLDAIERDINELRLRRQTVERQIEASIQALYNVLEFVREQDQASKDERVLLHRPRQADAPAAAPRAEQPRETRSSGQ